VSANAASKLEEFARGKMNGPDYAEFMQLLKSFSGGVSADEDVENEEERQERLAKTGNWNGSYSFASDTRMTGGCGLDARPVSGRRIINTSKAEAEFRKLFPSAGKLSR
jgi:hypothetical protein